MVYPLSPIPPTGSFSLLSPSLARAPNPFERLTTDYVLSTLKGMSLTRNPPRSSEWNYQTADWTPSLVGIAPETKVPLPAEALSLFAGTDVTIVENDTAERALNEITERQALACYVLYEKIRNGSTAIQIETRILQLIS